MQLIHRTSCGRYDLVARSVFCGLGCSAKRLSLRRVGCKAPALLESGGFPTSRDVGKEPYAELNNAVLRYGERGFPTSSLGGSVKKRHL